MFFQKYQVFPKMCYLRKYAVVGCKSMDTFGCMSMPFGCMYAATFGCMYAVVGCKSAETFGCMSAVVGCKFHTADSLPDSR